MNEPKKDRREQRRSFSAVKQHKTIPFHFLHFVLQFLYDGNYTF